MFYIAIIMKIYIMTQKRPQENNINSIKLLRSTNRLALDNKLKNKDFFAKN
jgi:hypothetical protein